MLNNNRFPKRNDKLLAKRQRTEGTKDELADRLTYHNFEKNIAKTNPRMAKNPRIDKLDKKQTLAQTQMYGALGGIPAGIYGQNMFGGFVGAPSLMGMGMNSAIPQSNIQIELLQKQIQILQMQQQQQQLLMSGMGNQIAYPGQFPPMMSMGAS